MSLLKRRDEKRKNNIHVVMRVKGYLTKEAEKCMAGWCKGYGKNW